MNLDITDNQTYILLDLDYSQNAHRHFFMNDSG